MEYKIKCPFCGQLNELDHMFCVYCGGKFNFDDNMGNLLAEVSDNDGESEDVEFIHCPKCNTVNFKESIECNNCGYLLDEDIKRSFNVSDKGYRRCPICGSILLLNDEFCSFCRYDFSDLTINQGFDENFFENNPEYKEYEKNIEFFNDINKFNNYTAFLFNFKKFCLENNIDLSQFTIGMIKCPDCSDYFSFISPHFIKTHKCPHCSSKFDFNRADVYCLNCGKPYRENQSKCDCGYEFNDIKCPKCGNYNPYNYNYCISCGVALRHPNVNFTKLNSFSCRITDNEIILNIEVLKKEHLKNPFSKNGGVRCNLLKAEYLKHKSIVYEILSRWLITSPTSCIGCQSRIDYFSDACPRCGIAHNSDLYQSRIRELKSIKNNYIKTGRGIHELSILKWDYNLTDMDVKDYLNSLAPATGESELEYKKRLLKEYGEISFIIYLIESEWYIYFDSCMNCGSKFQMYNEYCPSCGNKKQVTVLGALFKDTDTVSFLFPMQYDDFSKSVEEICRDNGGDILAGKNIVSCPECSNYFNYLNPDFVNTRKCPHCGLYFKINAAIYGDECDYYGLPYDEFMEMYYGVKRND